MEAPTIKALLLLICVPFVVMNGLSREDFLSGNAFSQSSQFSTLPTGGHSTTDPFFIRTLMHMIPFAVGQLVKTSNRSNEIDAIKSLYADLFGSYNRNVRPRLNLRESVVVRTKFVPITIIDFDTRRQVFTVFGYFRFDWRDEVLANGTLVDDTLMVPSKSIWLPHIRIGQAANSQTVVGNIESDNVALSADGQVQWVPEGIYSIMCKLDIKFYPFDEQTCTFTYYAEGDTSSEVDLEYYGQVDLTEYIPNAEWNMISATQETTYKDNVTHIDIHFKVKRRGLFEVMTVVAPVISMSVLNLLSFLLPISSGEKCVVAISMFFAYTIFMTVMVDSLPHDSLHISYLVLFVFYCLCFSTFNIVYSVMQYKVYSDLVNGTKPSFFKRLQDRCIGKRWRYSQNNNARELLFGKIDLFIFIVFVFINVALTTVFLAVISS